MSAFKRFIDAATGRFTSKADAEARPGETVGVSADRLGKGDRQVLRDARSDALGVTSEYRKAVILLAAIDEVLGEGGER